MKPKDSENRPKMNEAGCRFSYFRDIIKNKMEQENVLIIDAKGEIMRRRPNPNYAVLGRAGRGSIIDGSAAGESDGRAQGGGAMASPAESPAPEADSAPELEPPLVAENSAGDLS